MSRRTLLAVVLVAIASMLWGLHVVQARCAAEYGERACAVVD